MQQKLLNVPVLYLSRYINNNKSEYYRLLQAVRVDGAWEEWILWMLQGVEQTSIQTTAIISEMRSLMQLTKEKMRRELPRIYSQDLLNNLFRHPYTKIDFVIRDLSVHRNTATKYLDSLSEAGFVTKAKIGRDNFYLNQPLFQLLQGAGSASSLS